MEDFGVGGALFKLELDDRLEVDPGLTECDTWARAGLGLGASDPGSVPFIVYVGGGGRPGTVSIFGVKISIPAF